MKASTSNNNEEETKSCNLNFTFSPKCGSIIYQEQVLNIFN